MSSDEHIRITPFDWKHWPALWNLVGVRLEEHGIVLESTETPPIQPQIPANAVPDEYEWDLDYIGVVYLSGAGGYWIAWNGDLPVGMVGAQDLGGVAELRHMFVKPEYRRHEIGTRLVTALIEHCREKDVRAIEMWTAFDGVGQYLYRKCGFRRVSQRGHEFQEAMVLDEMRFRLDLVDFE